VPARGSGRPARNRGARSLRAASLARTGCAQPRSGAGRRGSVSSSSPSCRALRSGGCLNGEEPCKAVPTSTVPTWPRGRKDLDLRLGLPALRRHLRRRACLAGSFLPPRRPPRSLRGQLRRVATLARTHARGHARVMHECVRRAGLRDAYVELLCTRGRPAPARAIRALAPTASWPSRSRSSGSPTPKNSVAASTSCSARHSASRRPASIRASRTTTGSIS